MKTICPIDMKETVLETEFHKLSLKEKQKEKQKTKKQKQQQQNKNKQANKFCPLPNFTRFCHGSSQIQYVYVIRLGFFLVHWLRILTLCE